VCLVRFLPPSLIHHSLFPASFFIYIQPPPRAVVDQLFEASDDDHSGGIDQEEFTSIMVILCSQITSRIAVYYGILILLVPYIASMILTILDFVGVDATFLKVDSLFEYYAPSFMLWMVDVVPDSTWETLPNQIISLMLFFLVIPTMFNYIDEKSRSMAERTVVYSDGRGTTTTTSTVTVSGEKKEE